MSPDQLLAEFRDEWSAGRRPRVEEYLERVEPERQQELRAMLEVFLLDAPRPKYDDEAIEAIAREPAVQPVLTSLSGESGLWPSLLPRLRRRARLTRDEVVVALVASLSLSVADQEKTKRYVHGMEAGTLEAQGVSGRVLDALAGILGTARDELDRAGDFKALGLPTPRAAYFRADQTDEPQALVPASAPPPEAEWGEVDRLFLGGRAE